MFVCTPMLLKVRNETLLKSHFNTNYILAEHESVVDAHLLHSSLFGGQRFEAFQDVLAKV